MPVVKKINQTMIEQGFDSEIMSQFDFSQEKGNDTEPVIALIEKMDALLTKEQCLAIMEEQGCCKGGKRDKDCKAFGKEHVKKSLSQKLELIPQVEYMMTPVINDDGTFTITMSGFQNGVHTGNTTCSCGMIKKLQQPFSVSSTFCGCCAGHFRYHYQNMLGVSIRLKEIISSPLDTNGEKPCSFLFEIEQKPTIDGIACFAPDENTGTVDMFIELASRLGLKSEVKYSSPWAIEPNIRKSYKCVFTKNKRVIFTLDFSKKHFSVKANLYGIDKYKDGIGLSQNIINQVQSNAWDCAWYNGGKCNDKCRRGIPITINDNTEYKCIGGAFTFNNLTCHEWEQIAMLITQETSE